jgi:hypothetical protein
VFDCQVHFTARLIRVNKFSNIIALFSKSSTYASAALANANATEAASTATVGPSVPDPGHPTVLAEAAILS